MIPRLMTVTLLASAIALGGCASTGDLHPSGQMLKAGDLNTVKTLSGVALSPDAWPDATWWKGFNDPQLNQLIAEALKGSPDLQVAQARTQQALAAASAYDADRQPTLDANASYNGRRQPIDIDPMYGNRYAAQKRLGLDFAYSLDLWGGDKAAWQAAVGRANAAEIDSQAARLTLSAEIVQAYSNLGYAYVQHDLALDELHRAQHMAQLSEHRWHSGLDSKVEYEQTESLVASAEQQVTAAQQTIDSVSISLAALMGKGPDRGLQIERPQLLQPHSLTLPSTLPADLLGRRPDVVAAKLRVESASQDIKVAKTRFYPNINLTAGLGLTSMSTSDLLSAPSRFYQIAPALSLPLFDGGRLRANLAGRDADYDLAVAQYNQVLVNALAQVGDGIQSLHSLQSRVDAQQRARDIAKSSYDLAMQRYGSGIGSYLQVLSVEQQLLQADKLLANLKSQQVDASLQLVQALGGGFKPNNDIGATTDPAHTVALSSSSNVQ